jgi:predicted lactoylglutathione lyase
MLDVEDIKVFIPSRNYEESKQFYRAIGFNMTFESEEVAEFENGECSFLLQNFYNEGLANNLMMQLAVKSVETVHQSLSEIKRFEIKFKPPESVPWGRVLYLWGPAGELWHITEFH